MTSTLSVMRQLALSFTMLLSGSFALAFEAPAFTMAELKKEQAAGSTILVDVYASWCPTCKRQHKQLAELLSGSDYAHVKAFKLDYDNKDLVYAFQKAAGRAIPRQSTIVVFKGNEVVEFSVAQTGKSLKKALEGALKN